MIAVSCDKLSKTYRTPKKAEGVMGTLRSLFKGEKTDVHAVKEVTFSIEEGELVGFLGPNGAGKTTTLKMLSGILVPTGGTAQVLGYTPFDRKADMLRQSALVMGNKSQLWWDLPAADGFRVLKEIYEVPDDKFKERTEFLIETLDLKEKINVQLRRLSLGERMKCELVASLLHGPRVIFLDEPTLGLDLISQKRIREFLKGLHSREGNTILLTSHYMQDVQELCERVIVIDHGTKVYDGTLADLSIRFGDTRQIRVELDKPVEADDAQKFGRVLEHEEGILVLEVGRLESPQRVAQILEHLPVHDVQIQEMSVEEMIRRLFEESGVSRETIAASAGSKDGLN
jgi:ABC-2 type transport system ATP-binding protein